MDTSSATRAEVQANAMEIEKLRSRSHEYGNILQEHAGHFLRVEDSMEDVDKKLDAIHLSLKEDLGEIKGKQDQTNGRVTALEAKVAMLKGGLIVISAGLPFLLFAVSKFLEQ